MKLSLGHASAPSRATRPGLVAGTLALALLAGACASSSNGAAPPRSTSTSISSSTSTSPGAVTATGGRADAPGLTAAQGGLVAQRPFTVHTPPGYDAATPAPLVVLLHGFGVTGQVQEAYLKLTAATDARGMLYVVLDGTTNPRGRQFWNATDACCGSRSNVDDSAYISAVITDVQAHYAVDARRVFLVGHSNGGFMSYRMACDHADQIAAIVSIAGATFADRRRCRPSAPVATLEVHGTGDGTIAYRGGHLGGASFPSAPQTVRTWADYDGCAPVARRARATRAIVEGLPPASVLTYARGCRDNGGAELWTQPDGPHIPPFTATFPEQVVDFLLAHPKP